MEQIPLQQPQSAITVAKPQVFAPYVVASKMVMPQQAMATPQQAEVTAQQTAVAMPTITISAQIPAQQPQATVTIAKPQYAIPQASIINSEKLEPFGSLESLESLELKASTATPQHTAAATPMPVITITAQIPASQPQVTASIELLIRPCRLATSVAKGSDCC